MIEFKKSEPVPVEKTPVFKYDGKTWKANKVFSAGAMLTYLRNIRIYGQSNATEWLLEAALGEQGYAALREALSQTTDRAPLQSVVTDLEARIMGWDPPETSSADEEPQQEPASIPKEATPENLYSRDHLSVVPDSGAED